MNYSRTQIACTSPRTIAAAVAALAISAAALSPKAAADDANASPYLRAVALTDNGRLLRFRTDVPGNAVSAGRVRGLLAPDTALVGIDFRVQDGLLYGVGNGGGLYTIDTRNAAATQVGALTVPLSGSAFGVDFNPAADALRIVSDAGQNLRHPFGGPLAGMTQADGTLTYTPPPFAPGSVVPPAVAANGVAGAAYTNNDLDVTTGTTLYVIDAVLDQVAIQAPANNGLLSPTGKLGFDADTPRVGFDIYSRLRNSAVTGANMGFAVLTVNGVSRLYDIRLTTGRANRLGQFRQPVIDVALRLEQ